MTPSVEDLVTLEICDIPTEFRGIDISEIVRVNSKQDDEISRLEEEQKELEKRLSQLGGKNEHGSKEQAKDKQKKAPE